MSFRWTGCGGLYANPVMGSTGCADPGVVFDGTQYLMSCTSGNAANAFPIYASTDLVHWTAMGHILPVAAKPAWAVSDYWAPEIHKVGTQWVAYFSARQSNGKLAIGAASASDPLGPYTALTAPLLASATVGLIDAHEITDGTTPYLVYKEDGNATGNPTPIKIRKLNGSGTAFASATTTTLITNDQSWEGAVTEGPFIYPHKGEFFLFYSGNSYANASYAIGVARASTVTGPYTKAAGPIVVTGGAWVGPGHNSVVDAPGGDTYVVYHAWKVGMVNGTGDKRYPLVDQVQWGADGWPVIYGAPSSGSRPLP
jgi:beta-xylosidase